MSEKNQYLQSYGEAYEKRLEETINKVAEDYLPQALLWKNNTAQLKLVLKTAILTGNREIKTMLEKLDKEFPIQV